MKRFSLLTITAFLVGCGAAQPPASVPAPTAAVARTEPRPVTDPETATKPAVSPAEDRPATKPSSKAAAPPAHIKVPGKPVREPWSAHSPKPPIRLTVSAVAFSPDGKYMLTGYRATWRPKKVGKRFQLLRLWDVASGQELVGFEDVRENVEGVFFLPDSRHAVVGTSDGFISVWDMNIENLKVVRRFQVGKPGAYCMALSPNRKQLLTDSEGRLALYDVSTGNRLWTRAFDRAGWLCIGPDGKRAFIHQIAMIGPWDEQGRGEILPYKEGESWKWPLDFSPDGKAVLSVREGRLVLWELASGREIRQFDRPHSPRPGCRRKVSVERAHFASGGKSVVSGDDDLSMRRWDVASGKQVDVARIPDPEIERYADPEYIAAGGRLYDEARYCFSVDGRLALSIIGSTRYYPPGPPPQDWDSESIGSRLVLWDTAKLKALGPAVRKEIIRPLDPRIR